MGGTWLPAEWAATVAMGAMHRCRRASGPRLTRAFDAKREGETFFEANGTGFVNGVVVAF